MTALTSETGRIEAHHRVRHLVNQMPADSAPTGRFLQGGFTLLEMLVVTVILAIVATVAMLSGALAGPMAKANNERRAMLHLMNQHCDEAVLLGREGGVLLTARGYGFYWWNGEAWEPRPERLFRARDLDPALTLDYTLVDALPGNRDQPQVVCDSGGGISPFTATLIFDNQRLGIRVDDNGRIVADPGSA